MWHPRPSHSQKLKNRPGEESDWAVARSFYFYKNKENIFWWSIIANDETKVINYIIEY